ncbi:hypothetical protein [Streptomyces sp. NPDC060031]|uniref:hypothetical protein n=1 Tax=Streptomyces sp. NPDC060031 TaxID=3347043 RepID=UPI00367876D7
MENSRSWDDCWRPPAYAIRRLDEPEESHLGRYLAGTPQFYWAGCDRLTEAGTGWSAP